MTNEQLKEAIAIEATRRWKERGVHFIETLANIAVELTQEGWTPPEVVDPDIAEAAALYNQYHSSNESFKETLFAAIKRGRALAAEAKPGMVWVKHDGSKYCPAPLGVWVTTRVTTRVNGGGYVYYSTQMATDSNWRWVTHYAIIAPPEDAA